MKRLIAASILFGVALGMALSGGEALAGPDPCDSDCWVYACGECCYPSPAACPPVKHYRCYQYDGLVDCDGPFTCRCTFIGCGGLCEPY